MDIRAILCSDADSNLFALFDSESRLHVIQRDGAKTLFSVKLDNIADSDSDAQIRLYWHRQYICVTERFGLNAALVNTDTEKVRPMKREDYFSDISSYSIGFIERDGRVLLIHQTEWNRLDISDAETGECLSQREILCRQTAEGYYDENKKWHDPRYEEKNYIDYFHSLIHVSPNYINFLSNGWVWHPADIIRCYNADSFFKSFDNTSFCTECYNANWDRPCAFIDDDCFVIAIDRENNCMDDNTAPEKNILLTNPYICSVVSPEKSIQLAYFRLSDKVCSPLRASTRDHPECEQKALFKGENRWLSPYKTAKADMFGPGDEAIGELHYDKASGLLIALSAAGAYAATPDGEVQWHNPELIYNANAPHQGWQYSPAHRFFYRFMNDEYCATILNRSLIYRKVSQYC